MIFSESRKPTAPGWVWVELYGAALPVLLDGDEICVWSPSGTLVSSSVHKDMRFGDTIETPIIEPESLAFAERKPWWKHMTRELWIIGFIAAFIVVVVVFGCKSPTEPPATCESIPHCNEGVKTDTLTTQPGKGEE